MTSAPEQPRQVAGSSLSPSPPYCSAARARQLTDCPPVGCPPAVSITFVPAAGGPLPEGTYAIFFEYDDQRTGTLVSDTLTCTLPENKCTYASGRYITGSASADGSAIVLDTYSEATFVHVRLTRDEAVLSDVTFEPAYEAGVLPDVGDGGSVLRQAAKNHTFAKECSSWRGRSHRDVDTCRASGPRLTRGKQCDVAEPSPTASRTCRRREVRT